MHAILLPLNPLKRLRNTLEHPDQAALVARIPMLGRRVPARDFWRRQPVDPRRAWSHGTSMAMRMVGRGADAGAGAAANVGRRMRAGGPLVTLPLVAVAATAGAAAMYYADPHQGRRRRALFRDKLAHLRRVVVRDVPRTAERRGRFLRGVARGVQHDAVGVLRRNGHAGAPDNETLVARVRSEVLRDDRIKAGEIHVDAYEGTVTLRGQLDELEEIRHIIAATRRVEGVHEVRSYLHLPGTLPPNKAESYLHEPVPAHLTR